MTTTPERIVFASEAELDQDIAELSTGAEQWAVLPIKSRIALLEATHAAIAANAEAWAAAAIAAKSIPAGNLEAEEWLAGPYATLAGVGAVIDSLGKIRDGKSPLSGIKTGSAPGGRTTLRMLPSNLYELNLFSGFHAELWLEPGVSESLARAKAGLGALRHGESGGVGLVLGAGNVTAIGPLDVLYELVAHNRVSVLKLNPTFGTLIDVYTAAFGPLIDAGLVRIVNGGAEVGAYLAQHRGIDHVHITGSAITHDLIVWGSGTERSELKLSKPITSELGGVSPIIVVPGTWSKADLRFQAENVATQRLNNSGHNCIAGQALILSSDWEQREEFLGLVRDVLAAAPARPVWYPGSERKLDAAQTSYPGAEHLGARMLIAVDETTSQDLFTTEYFAPVLGHTTVPGTGTDFFDRAVEFANTRLDGTLGASIIVAPADRKAMGSAFEETLANLRYGTIGVNVWSAFGFLTPSLSWGAYPGNTLEDVGSGIGIVHNSRLVDDVERSVIYAPFRPFPRSLVNGELSLSPKPPWFLTAKTALGTAERLTDFSKRPSLRRLPGIINQALRG